MIKVDSIARKILGWKLNRWDRWFDYEKGVFIHESDFQPEHNIDHAMLIVERLEELGFTYTIKDFSKICFNDICASGETLAQAITNAAYSLVELSSIPDNTRIAQKLC